MRALTLHRCFTWALIFVFVMGIYFSSHFHECNPVPGAENSKLPFKTNNYFESSEPNIQPWNDPEYRQNNAFVDINAVRSANLVFVGGYPRSGTTLMRAILDVHSRVRCGPEDMILTFLLAKMRSHLESEYIQNRMKYNRIQNRTTDDSIALYIYNYMANNGARAPRLCMKEPAIMYHTSYLKHLFPNAKFVYMIRDGRASAYSFLVRKTPNVAVKKASFKKELEDWNMFSQIYNDQCEAIGPDSCLRVKYENLILETNKTVRSVISFLKEPWENGLLEHHNYIGTEIPVSEMDWSNDQIKKPIYKEALTSWHVKIPHLTEEETRRIAPMLEVFDYSYNLKETTATGKAFQLPKARDALKRAA